MSETGNNIPMPISGMSDGDYEKLVQNVHRSIINSQGITNVEVLHDVKIIGKSGHKHQLDVYWKFNVGDMQYQTAIECRKYKSKITVNGVKAFKATLDDIGNINGIMVTTNGYQKGAVLFGKQYDVKLAVLRSTTDEDLDNIIQVIVINVHAITRHIRNVNVNLNQAMFTKERFEEINNKIAMFSSADAADGIRNSNGDITTSWREVSERVDTDTQNVGFGDPASIVLADEGMYILFPELGLIQIQSVVVNYVTNSTLTVVRSENPYPPQYLMETINRDGEIIHIHDDGTSLHLTR